MNGGVWSSPQLVNTWTTPREGSSEHNIHFCISECIFPIGKWDFPSGSVRPCGSGLPAGFRLEGNKSGHSSSIILPTKIIAPHMQWVTGMAKLLYRSVFINLTVQNLQPSEDSTLLWPPVRFTHLPHGHLIMYRSLSLLQQGQPITLKCLCHICPNHGPRATCSQGSFECGPT